MRDHCTCSGYSFPDDGGICSYCERQIEEAEADDRNEAHARDPEDDDFPQIDGLREQEGG